MEAEVRREKEGEEFERGAREKAQRDEERTRRNREKRDKARARKAGKGKGGNGGGGGGAAAKTAPGGGEGAGAGAAGDEAGRTKADGPKDNKHGDDGDNGAEKISEQPAGIVIHDDD